MEPVWLFIVTQFDLVISFFFDKNAEKSEKIVTFIENFLKKKRKKNLFVYFALERHSVKYNRINVKTVNLLPLLL